MDVAPWGLVDIGPILAREGCGDRAVGAVAAAQHGLITTQQLSFVGFDRNAVSYRARRGRLHRIHRGVYAVGHRAIGALGWFAAGVLACGRGSVLSHWSAAAFWRMLSVAEGRIHVSIAGAQRRSREGLMVHRPVSLMRSDVVIRELVPVTTPARTILDLADAGASSDLETALNEARALRLVNDAGLRRTAEMNSNRLGARRLVALLAAEDSPGFSRSRAEIILRGLISKARLPPPRRNVRVHGHELDFFWPDLRLNVEADGGTTHARARNFESDRARDADLATHGIQVMRFTWKQLTTEPMVVVARLSAAVALRSPNAS